MKQFEGRTNKSVLSFTRNGTYVLKVLEGISVGAKLVAIEIANNATSGSIAVGARAIGTAHASEVFDFTLGARTKVTQIHSIFYTVGPPALPLIQLKAPAGTEADLVFSVLGSWGGDAVKTLPLYPEVTGWTEPYVDGAWLDYDMTSLVGADAGNVEAAIGFIRTEGGSGLLGADLRATGSVWEEFGGNPSGLFLKYDTIVGVDDDNVIEARFTSEHAKVDPSTQVGWVYLVGYVLRDTVEDGSSGNFYRYRAIDDPVDDDVAAGAWAALDVRPATSPIVDEIYWRSQLQGNAALPEHYVREVGSTDAALLTQRNRSLLYSRPIKVSALFEAEHFFQIDSGGNFSFSWLFGYLEGPAPTQATAPSPANLATDVSIEATLAWTAGVKATSHDVYFGTDPTPDAGEFQGNQSGVTFNPGELATDTVYYWRVDEVNAIGTTTGVVWSFTTEASVCVAATPGIRPRVLGKPDARVRVLAETGSRARVLGMTDTRARVLAAPAARPRVLATVRICGVVFNMKATPLCAAEMKWNSDNVLELVDVVDELTGTPAAITSADSVTVEIFDADGDTEHSVSPVTLNQVGSTNAWRNTVLANAANEFAIGQRIRLVFKFDGGAGIVGEFEALSVVVTAKS